MNIVVAQIAISTLKLCIMQPYFNIKNKELCFEMKHVILMCAADRNNSTGGDASIF